MVSPSTLTSWLKERIRDLILWPLNLIRDFPRRANRIGQTLGAGFLGLVHLSSEFRRASKSQQRKSWLIHKTKQFVHGLHLLIVQLFDLAGGPEIAQFFMHLITHTTPLTDEEISLMTGILGPKGMRYQDIRIAEGGLLEKVFQVNGRLAFTTWYTVNLPKETPENQHHTRQNKALLVHELFHTFQNEKVGTRYMTEAVYILIKTKRSCYQYGGYAGLRQAQQNLKQFHHYNREQQAQIIQDYFTRRQNNLDTTAYLPYLHQLQKGHL